MWTWHSTCVHIQTCAYVDALPGIDQKLQLCCLGVYKCWCLLDFCTLFAHARVDHGIVKAPCSSERVIERHALAILRLLTSVYWLLKKRLCVAICYYWLWVSPCPSLPIVHRLLFPISVFHALNNCQCWWISSLTNVYSMLLPCYI